jgi:hypothetical protein
MESWSTSRRVATGQDYNMHVAAVVAVTVAKSNQPLAEAQGLVEGSR